VALCVRLLVSNVYWRATHVLQVLFSVCGVQVPSKICRNGCLDLKTRSAKNNERANAHTSLRTNVYNLETLAPHAEYANYIHKISTKYSHSTNKRIATNKNYSTKYKSRIMSHHTLLENLLPDNDASSRRVTLLPVPTIVDVTKKSNDSKRGTSKRRVYPADPPIHMTVTQTQTVGELKQQVQKLHAIDADAQHYFVGKRFVHNCEIAANALAVDAQSSKSATSKCATSKSATSTPATSKPVLLVVALNPYRRINKENNEAVNKEALRAEALRAEALRAEAVNKDSVKEEAVKEEAVEKIIKKKKDKEEQGRTKRHLLTVWLSLLEGGRLSVRVWNTDAVWHLKQAVAREHGIPVAAQCLLYVGCNLHDCAALQHCNVQHDTAIHLVVRTHVAPAIRVFALAPATTNTQVATTTATTTAPTHAPTTTNTQVATANTQVAFTNTHIATANTRVPNTHKWVELVVPANADVGAIACALFAQDVAARHQDNGHAEHDEQNNASSQKCSRRCRLPSHALAQQWKIGNRSDCSFDCAPECALELGVPISDYLLPNKAVNEVRHDPAQHNVTETQDKQSGTRSNRDDTKIHSKIQTIVLVPRKARRHHLHHSTQSNKQIEEQVEEQVEEQRFTDLEEQPEKQKREHEQKQEEQEQEQKQSRIKCRKESARNENKGNNENVDPQTKKYPTINNSAPHWFGRWPQLVAALVRWTSCCSCLHRM
jgi:hypothetical protein